MLNVVYALSWLGLTSLSGLALATAVPRDTCVVAWQQCGGNSYSGATCCQTGSSCVVINEYYSQCQPTTSVLATSTSVRASTTSVPTSSTSVRVSTTATSSSIVGTSTSSSFISSSLDYTTRVSLSTATSTHTQSAYPAAASSVCGAWTLVENVCCPSYCGSDNTSESCSSSANCDCTTPPAAMCKSGTMYPEVHSVSSSEDWHYSRSTHFGLTSGGACGFGLYGLCTSSTASWIDSSLGDTCKAFCTAYPNLCKDPAGITLRGNFAAPNGDYYSQFWPSLPGDLDNYLSCGECMELIRTKADGTDYAVGEAGYTDPIVLEVVDSCPCNANSKWCCGPGADHCGEIDFKYGCPLPTGSIHLDLSDIAMGRLQGNGSLAAGVIPTRYKRIPCPTPGNIYLWLRDSGSPYYFALSVVNTAGVGSVTNIEVQGSGTTTWTSLIHDPNYTEARPQERYGSWTIPQGSGPFNPPIAVRITSPTGEQVVSPNAITTFTAPSSAPAGFYYIDLGVQFTS